MIREVGLVSEELIGWVLLFRGMRVSSRRFGRWMVGALHRGILEKMSKEEDIF